MMNKLQKRIRLWIVVSLMVLFVACSKEEEKEPILLSDAIEEYSIWFSVQGEPVEPTEDSRILQLFYFEENELTVYDLNEVDMDLGEVSEFSDEEVVSHVQEKLEEEDSNYVEPESSTFTLDIHQDVEEEETFAMTVDVDDEVILTLLDEPVSNNISSTEFIGLTLDHVPNAEEKDVFVTRVEDSSFVLEFDQPDTNKDFVTVDEWMERQKQTDLESQNLQELDEEEYDEIFNDPGAEIYARTCLACHGENLEGNIGPDLTLVGDRFSKDEIKDIVLNGKGNMPADMVDNEEDAEILAEWLSESMKK